MNDKEQIKTTSDTTKMVVKWVAAIAVAIFTAGGAWYRLNDVVIDVKSIDVRLTKVEEEQKNKASKEEIQELKKLIDRSNSLIAYLGIRLFPDDNTFKPSKD